MGKKLRTKIFYSWVAGLITYALSQEILKISFEFSALFGLSMAIILTVYFIADNYSLLGSIKEEIKSWLE